METVDRQDSSHADTDAAPKAPGLINRKSFVFSFAAMIIAVWLVLAGLGGPTFGKLSSVSSNDQSTFLPANAESTQAMQWQKKFAVSDDIPAIVMLEASAKLSNEQLKSLSELTGKLASVDGVRSPATGQRSVIGPIPSKDGQAVEYIVPITKDRPVKSVVSDLRSVVASSTPSSLTGYVTGPAGLSADFAAAFGGIDGILLVVALIAVLLILLVVYRSILLPIIVLLTSVFALTTAILVVYLMAQWGWIKLNGQSQGILSILVIGAATDYSLLFVARFKEALHRHESRITAVRVAIGVAFKPILASAATVIIGLLCLLISDLNSNKSLGPIAAIGIVFSFLSALTFLPAILSLVGRAAFWPFPPKVWALTATRADNPSAAKAELDEFSEQKELSGVWGRISKAVTAKPRLTWIVTALVLLVLTIPVLGLKANGVSQTQLILAQSQAVDGQKALARHFDAGSGSPLYVIVNASDAQAMLTAVKGVSGLDDVAFETAARSGGGSPSQAAPLERDGKMMINATLTSQPDSSEAAQTLAVVRQKAKAIDADALVGGSTATSVDTNETSQRDLLEIIPVVLVVILLILMLLLRSIVAPVILVATVVLSYLTSLGVAAIAFNNIFNFPGADPAVPLFGFVFLVALGVDYNIFLMSRVREEALIHGTHAGIRRGLALTGGVITSAGVVLAATFAALGVIPILFLVQIAFIVAFGVLLDTLIVRTILVPALAYDIGRKVWWPSKLAQSTM